MTIIKTLAITALCLSPISALAEASAHDHSGAIYHAITIETALSQSDGGSTGHIDLDGWVGGDTHKLWFKAEADIADGEVQSSEVWALYSRNISTFWDVQAGVRYDDAPDSHTYLVLGTQGLAPYFFETEAHLFVRDDGAISARLRQDNTLLLTNRLIAEPYIEADLSLDRDPQAGLGTVLTEMTIGLQTRYEITRRFAPYVEVAHSQTFGETKTFAQGLNQETSESSVQVGIRWLF